MATFHFAYPVAKSRAEIAFLGRSFGPWAFHRLSFGFGIGSGLHHAVRPNEQFGVRIDG
jgi:hypothetical protein